jgi:hypothetical protein
MEQVMLPPLGAALSASIDYQTTARQSLRPPQAPAAIRDDARTTLPANLLSGGRIDLLSLSGQLHLAQGLSIFAETVGAYLKISRREGESLVDYAHRLAEALKTLTTAQRAILEQSLAQMVRGMTLRLLTEILDNPLGPEAARLNAYMEAGQFANRDLLARAVVSSYRQNAASDVVAGTTAPRSSVSQPSSGLPDAQSLATTGGRPSPATGATTPASSQAAAPASQSPTGGASAGPALPADQRRPQDGILRAPATTTTAVSATAIPNAEAARPALDAAQLPAADGTIAPQRASGPLASHHGNGGENRAAASRLPNGSPVAYDAPSIARMGPRPQEGARSLPGQTVRYFAEGLLAHPDPALAVTATLKPGTASHIFPPTNVDEATLPAETAAVPDDLPMLDGRRVSADSAARGAIEVLAPAAASVGAASKTGGFDALIEQAFLAPMAQMVAREGFVQTFVAYSPAPVPPEDEERDVERLAPVDEDGEGRSSGQEAAADHQHDPGDSNEENGEPEDTHAAIDGDAADHAQDLYWRMADLS